MDPSAPLISPALRDPTRTVLVTGATGYVGGRLVPRLLAAGWRVRCLARSSRKLEARSWAGLPGVEIVHGDVNDAPRLVQALRGCYAAYYLIHSMETVGPGYAARDRELARAFAHAAEQAQVPRIIYLGGLGELGDNLSEHLSSRREIEACLASGAVPVTVLRAAMIIGSGSASFEILRYLTERLPVMITPRWVATQCQPIAVREVLRYLVECLDTPATLGRTLDIGGPDVLTYHQLIQMMAGALGLRPRLIVPVPLLTPRLSSLWIHLVTPVSYRMARPLADGLRNRVVCRNDDARQMMPGTMLVAREAVDLAVGRLRGLDVETSWTDAGVIAGDPDWAGGKVFVDRRELRIAACPEAVFAAVCKVGGGHGYYAADWLWRVRGLMDRIIGGPGLRRSRRHPERLGYGDALDFWRVTAIDPPHRLRLRAEMKLPGDALLEFEIRAADPLLGAAEAGSSVLVQTARFKPRGLTGLMYWYAVKPLHEYVFRGMTNGIRRAAEKPPFPTP